MPDRPKMPVPQGEMTPQQLADRIRDWAMDQGFEYEATSHGSEYGKITVRDPQGGHTTTVVPNAHQGRRLKKHQVRYTVKGINDHWEE